MPETQKKKNIKLPLLIIGIVTIGFIILAVAAGAVYYFFFYTPAAPTAEISDLPPTAGPDIMFLEPASGTFAEVGDSIQVAVSAQDITRVSRLDLWVDDTLAISLPSPDPAGINPLILTYPLVAVEPGEWSLVARAYNMRGAMTESPAITVFVSQSDASDAPADDQSILYIVKEGDTLQSIADKTGSSLSGIQAANGGIQNVAPGQNIGIPHPPLPKPPQPPAAPKGGNMGAIPGLLPALPPGSIQANLPGIDPGQQQLAPNLLPDPKTIMDISDPPIKAPQLTQIVPTGCKVELTWTDNSDNETGFAIYRRQVPNEAISKPVGQVAANLTTFIDTVPFPAKYQYTVEALGELTMLPQNQADILNIQQVINTARSNFGTADVQPDANCIAQPAMKHVYFEIDSLFIRDKSFTGAALWYSINDSAPRRVPPNQGSYPLPNGTDFSGKGYIPLPSSVYLNPDQPIVVKIWAAGHTDYTWFGDGIGPVDLGMTINTHLAKDIQPKGKYFFDFDFSNDKFYGKYLIAITDSVYGGSYSSTQLPSPTDLHVTEQPQVNYRSLVWNWKGDESLLEGYVIYRSYSCIGQETEYMAPMVVSKKLKGFSLPTIYEPQGCTYKYQVTALGKLGESLPSNTVTGKTEDTYGIAYVTLKQVKILSLDESQSGEFMFHAGSLRKGSTPMWLENQDNIIYLGEIMFFEGKSPNNIITLVLNPEYSMNLAFNVSGIRNGQTQLGSICSEAITLDPGDWNQPSSTHTLTSNNRNCEAIVEITTIPPTVGTSGQKAPPQADLEVRTLATIGKKVFIKIHNNGPQDLYGAKIGLCHTWGTGVRDIADLYKARIDGPYGGSNHTVDIKAGSSIWLYMDKYFDEGIEFFRARSAKVGEGAFNFAYTCVVPLGGPDKDIPLQYLDDNDENNRLRLPMLDILPMQ